MSMSGAAHLAFDDALPQGACTDSPVEPMPGKCPDCFGTGAVLDDDGSFTGVVGQPMACTCMGFSRSR